MTGQHQYSSEEDTLTQVGRLEPLEFEYFVASLWELLGWNTTVTPEVGDAGVDVIATKNFPFELKIRIEVKLYTEGNKVGGPAIRKYALPQGTDADCAAIVTTSSFTDQAMIEANATNTKTINGQELVRLIQELKAEELLKRFVEAEDVRRVHNRKHVPAETIPGGIDPRETKLAAAISGLHAGHAERLARENIDTIESLAEADIESLSDETGLPEERLDRWITHAKYLRDRSPDYLEGIGAKLTERLANEDMDSIADVAAADPKEIAQATEYGESFGKKIRNQATARPGRPTTHVDGIGPKTSAELAKAGIDTVGDLAAADPGEIADQISKLSESLLEKLVERA